MFSFEQKYSQKKRQVSLTDIKAKNSEKNNIKIAKKKMKQTLSWIEKEK